MSAPTPLHPTNPRIVRLAHEDNVVVAVDPIVPGAVVEGVTASARVPRGHKFAVVAIPEGAPIRKFGQIIGFASRAIAPGEWVHEHNVGLGEDKGDFTRDYRFCEDARPVAMVPEAERATFEGYRRADGRVGTRNYVGVLTSVNCSATVARFIAEEARRSGLLDAFPGIDGIIPLTHGTGCGYDIQGEGADILKRTLWGYAANPNMGGVIMVGLGCEGLQIDRWKRAYGIEESETFRSFTIQDTGGTRRTIEAGVAALREMLPAVAKAKRETVPASELMLALQCGGSDGYSGITANPALGAAVDRLVAEGGTAILSETPEIYGAEHLLTARAASPRSATSSSR